MLLDEKSVDLDPTTVKKIFITQWGRLGDIVSTLGIVKEIRNQYPSAHIVLLTNVLGATLCPAGVMVDEVINRDAHKTTLRWLKLVFLLRRRRFDLALNLRPSSDGVALMMRLMGATFRVGYGRSKWLNSCYNIRPKVTEYNSTVHEHNTGLQSYLVALKLPVKQIEHWVYISKQDERYAEDFFKKHRLNSGNTLVLAPFATSPGGWPHDYFLVLMRRFYNQFPSAKVILNWVPNQSKIVEQYQQVLPNCILPEQTTPNQFAALMQRAGLVLCVNSGSMNLAYAVGTPTITPNTNPCWILPEKSGQHITIESYPKDSKGKIRPPTDPVEMQHCAQLIPVDQVWPVLEERWRALTREIA